jgi:Zn-dependent M28 family amino/carboxypeptidase
VKSAKFFLHVLTLAGLWLGITGCKGNNQQTEGNESTQKQSLLMQPAPVFNADTAYYFIEKQVAFGPRVPNTEAHRRCGDFLTATLKRYGFQTIEQYFDAVAYNGTILKSRNIIGSFNPEARKRILLMAHWDTRPFADQDKERSNEPILGANDGGSGVGVLLEVARILATDSLRLEQIGIDIIFFDSEDYGQPEDDQRIAFKPDSWCLGSQYWAKNKHVPNYSAFYGILLDMVGAKGARFYQEGNSMEFAPSIVKKVWDTAHQIGFGSYFIYQRTGPITDDHLYVNQLAGIPSIDIIQYSPNSGFGDFWHTHNDTMEVIDPNTLKAVGQTLLQVLFNEQKPVQ